MGLDRKKASRMALYAADAENLFTTIAASRPPNARGVPELAVKAVAPIMMLNNTDWAIKGQIRCDDDLSLVQYIRRVVGAGENNFFYGFLLERLADDPSGDFRKGDFLAVLRGTMKPIEWLLDVLAAPDLISKIAHPLAGLAPSGFISIYESMTPLSPHAVDLGRAARAIGDVVNRDDRKVTVVGHSLGAVLASYLILDLASEVNGADNLDGFLIACPQPGTDPFAAAYRGRVARYNVVNWIHDIVPRVPPPPFRALLNGSPTQNVVVLAPDTPGIGPTPPNNPGENHHAVNYALMLDPDNVKASAAVDWKRSGEAAEPHAATPASSPELPTRAELAHP